MNSTITFPLLIQGGLVFIATSTWTDAGKRIIDQYYPYGHASAFANIVYAVCVTLIILIMIYVVNYVYAQSREIGSIGMNKLGINTINAYIPDVVAYF